MVREKDVPKCDKSLSEQAFDTAINGIVAAAIAACHASPQVMDFIDFMTKSPGNTKEQDEYYCNAEIAKGLIDEVRRQTGYDYQGDEM